MLKIQEYICNNGKSNRGGARGVFKDAFKDADTCGHSLESATHAKIEGTRPQAKVNGDCEVPPTNLAVVTHRD